MVWHWGPEGDGDLQGFLRSESHYSSTCADSWNSGPAPTCHTIGDVGADLLLGALKLEGSVRSWTWAVPVDDIVAVYRRMGSAFRYVTPDAITHCMKLLYAGRAAVWAVGDAAVPHFSSHAAFMEQELNDFVYGGLEDMAAQTADAWRQLVQVLRGEQPMPPPFHPPAHSTLTALSSPATSLASSWWVRTSTPHPAKLSIVSAAPNTSLSQRTTILPAVIEEAIQDSREIYLEMLNVIQKEHDFVHLEKTGAFVWGSGATFREQMGLSIGSGKTIVTALSTRSLLLWDVDGNFLHQLPVGGRSVVVAEVTGDGYEDVIVATRNGSVVLVDGRTMRSTLILQSDERAFATRIDVSDCDGDGRSDVLISSPQMACGGYQRGSASVYVASSAGIDWLKPTWHAEGESPLECRALQLYQPLHMFTAHDFCLCVALHLHSQCDSPGASRVASHLKLTQEFKIRSGSDAAWRALLETSLLDHRAGARAAMRVSREWAWFKCLSWALASLHPAQLSTAMHLSSNSDFPSLFPVHSCSSGHPATAPTRQHSLGK